VTPGSRDTRKGIRVVIAEDQGMVLGALAALLEIEGDISVVARARDGKEALESVLAHKTDVFITDIEMPRMSGLEVAAELQHSASQHTRHHCDDVCALRLSAAGTGCGGLALFAQAPAR